jgi:primosomal protein N' (replication factor Y)
VWAPTGQLDAVVVLDEHDESLQEERNPTWHARDVAIERARRAGVPCLLVSPAPSLAALAVADRVIGVSRADQRRGWPVVEVVDRRDDEPGRGGLFSARAADLLRTAECGVAILNRKGRAPMLACGSCGELIRTEDGEFLMTEVDGALISPRTGETRPLVCAVCTGTQLKRLRLGVTRAAEELSMLVSRPVTEVSAENKIEVTAGDELLLGTEAVLHRGVDADVVVFLDFDQELHAPRYRAAEQAMWLLVRAARTIGRRRAEGRLLVQTRSPDHRVLQAAVSADPGRMVEEEQALRAALGFPPAGALAEFGGAGAPAFAASIKAGPDVMVLGPRPDGRYLLRAAGPDQLAAVLAETPRPKERMRVAVDPPRI